MIIEQIHSSYIAFNPNHVIHTREYYLYVVQLLKIWLANQNLTLNIILGNYNINFNNTNKTIKVDLQCEHTLVKDGGRSVSEKIFGNIKHDNGYYLVRIDKYNYFNSLDIVIDYSLANICNISSSDKFNNFLSKIIYIAPAIYDINFNNDNKTDIIALFTKFGNDRRTNIITQLNKSHINIKIIENCFSKECLLDLYGKTKIIINIHQTDHHHTFEELRVLPALLNGVIIISEECPLTNTIPYSDYIIWSKYGDIPSKTIDIINNYSYYYKRLFIDGNLKNILTDIKERNKIAFNGIKI